MLVLTRRSNEILIAQLPDGTTLEITVVGVKGNQVRLGISAPEEVTILREELLETD